MNTITLRPAQPQDKPAITALAAKIWDGEDYLALPNTTWEIDYDLEMWVFQHPIG
jgi:hypothetical protein